MVLIQRDFFLRVTPVLPISVFEVSIVPQNESFQPMAGLLAQPFVVDLVVQQLGGRLPQAHFALEGQCLKSGLGLTDEA